MSEPLWLLCIWVAGVVLATLANRYLIKWDTNQPIVPFAIVFWPYSVTFALGYYACEGIKRLAKPRTK